LSAKQADYFYAQGNDYMIQIDEDKFFIATIASELEEADFLNHSCDPSCGIGGNLRIVAIRDIGPGEEVTIDYAMSESSEYEMNCKCSSSNCRGVVRGKDWRDRKLQMKYRGFFSDYLRKKIEIVTAAQKSEEFNLSNLKAA
jgi:hypothetical protein